MEVYHVPVLLNECISGMKINPDGTYVDATFGGGGHSKEILKHLRNGKLFSFDQDGDVSGNIIDDKRFFFIMHNFRYLKNFLAYYNIEKVDGILADLGVSSHDFDIAGRGFSYRFDGRLDMRMNQQTSKDAVFVLNNYTEEELGEIFRDYGEIGNYQKLASAIIAARSKTPITNTTQLLEIVKPFIPKKIENKYLAKLFMSLRIEVNNEIDVLKEFLTNALEVLNEGARLVVVTYHSLEDRLVKNFMRSGNFEGVVEKDFFGNVITPFRLINNKVIVPGDLELMSNPRSRSAKLRIAEKI
jgi:16S rRNA (cytosine1402-N4)-methyltransferase